MYNKNSDIIISDDIIKGDVVGEVMGDWELPLMVKSANVVHHNDGDYLEIGFGLGLFSNACWDINMNSYTIVEIHPDIIEKALEWSKDKPNVRVIQGDWYDNILTIGDRQYDGIYFDTHLDPHRLSFRDLIVDETLKDNGIFCYFNHGKVDSFNYKDRLITEEILLKTSDKSDYKGTEQILLLNYIINDLNKNIIQ